MKKGYYNLFHIPYYQALIVREGEVVAQSIVKKTKSRPKYFRLEKYRSVFILPKKVENAIRIKSGYLLVYDIKNAFPLASMSPEDKMETLGENEAGLVKIRGLLWNRTEEPINDMVILPNEYEKSPINPEELHEFFEAKITEDIMSDEHREIPMWLIYLISIAVIAVIVLGGLYMVTKDGGNTIIYNMTNPTPIPTPTPGYVVIP